MWKMRRPERALVPQGWRANGGTSWSLSVAVYIRDVYGLPATRPFFVPPMAPEVPEHIPVTGPAGDSALADEWAQWFDALVRSRADIHDAHGLLLDERSPSFRQAVENQLPHAAPAADRVKAHEAGQWRTGSGSPGVALPKLVRSLEKELGRKSAPFNLEFRLLPVAGPWLHQVAPGYVLMDFGIESDPDAMRRLLGPAIRELA